MPLPRIFVFTGLSVRFVCKRHLPHTHCCCFFHAYPHPAVPFTRTHTHALRTHAHAPHLHARYTHARHHCTFLHCPTRTHAHAHTHRTLYTHLPHVLLFAHCARFLLVRTARAAAHRALPRLAARALCAGGPLSSTAPLFCARINCASLLAHRAAALLPALCHASRTRARAALPCCLLIPCATFACVALRIALSLPYLSFFALSFLYLRISCLFLR